MLIDEGVGWRCGCAGGSPLASFARLGLRTEITLGSDLTPRLRRKIDFENALWNNGKVLENCQNCQWVGI